MAKNDATIAAVAAARLVAQAGVRLEDAERGLMAMGEACHRAGEAAAQLAAATTQPTVADLIARAIELIEFDDPVGAHEVLSGITPQMLRTVRLEIGHVVPVAVRYCGPHWLQGDALVESVEVGVEQPQIDVTARGHLGRHFVCGPEQLTAELPLTLLDGTLMDCEGKGTGETPPLVRVDA